MLKADFKEIILTNFNKDLYRFSNIWRTERDLNPRALIESCTLSRGVVSATHPSVQEMIFILSIKYSLKNKMCPALDSNQRPPP